MRIKNTLLYDSKYNASNLNKKSLNIICRSMSQYLCTLFLLMHSASNVMASSDMKLDPDLLASKVTEFMDKSLKREKLQSYVWDNLAFSEQQIDAEEDLKTIVQVFDERFQNTLRAVQRLKEAVLESYENTSSTIQDCCSDFETEDSRLFNLKVAKDMTCEKIAPTAPEGAILLSDHFKEACIKNIQEIPSLKWQYFGSAQGVATRFPASEQCGEFDNRHRPWYIQANNPEQKHVVILVDTSGSMRRTYQEKSLLMLGVNAAKIIIDTLNPYDTFALLAFSNRVETWREITGGGTCFSEELAQATPQNKKRLIRYLDTLFAAGGSYYGTAFSKAFDYLEKALALHLERYNTTNAFPDSSIHLISDGVPDEGISTIKEVLQKRIRDYGKTTLLFTYGVGNGMNNADFKLLQTIGDYNFGSLQGRGFTQIKDPDNLRFQLAEIYKSSLNSNSTGGVVFSEPYVDYAGLGQIITGSLPVYRDNELLGVAAIDMSLEHLLSESTYFRPNEYSYSFVIDRLGLIVNHPLFPYLDDPDALYVSAPALERDSGFTDVFESMLRGETGNKTFLATKILPYGDSKKHGVAQRQMLSTYYWKAVPKTKFSVCVVVTVNCNKSKLIFEESLAAGSFLHHRLDLVPPKSPCVHFDKLSSRDKSSVFFSWISYSDTQHRLSFKVSKEVVKDIERYIEKTGANLHNLKDGIREEVIATEEVDKLWSQPDENELKVLWRYLTTKQGMYRRFPAAQLPSDFQPTKQAWYQIATALPGVNIISPPHIDPASGSYVITLSNVLLQKKPMKNDTETIRSVEVFAVVGMDVLPAYFHNVFLKLYPVCEERGRFKCLLIDKSGYIILTDDYSSTNSKSQKAKHLAEVEPQVTSILIRDGVFQRIKCSNIASGLLQRSYSVRDDQSVFWGTYGEGFFDFFGFKFIPVPNTNSYLIIRMLSTSPCVNSFFCHCGSQSSKNSDASTADTQRNSESGQSRSKRSLKRYRRNDTESLTVPVTKIESTKAYVTNASVNTYQTSTDSNDHNEPKMGLKYLEGIEDISSLELIPPHFASSIDLCKASWEDLYCECPCPSENPLFDPCLNQYDLVSATIPICTPEIRSIAPLEQVSNLSDLPKCYNITYEEYLMSGRKFPVGIVVGISVSVLTVLMFCAGTVIYNDQRVQLKIRRFQIRRKQLAKEEKMYNLAVKLNMTAQERRNSIFSQRSVQRADSAHGHVMYRASHQL